MPAWLRWPARSAAARLDQARALARQGRHADAVAIWVALAEAGDARAQTNLGASLATGTGVPQDLVVAQAWLQRGAASGDPLGQRNLGTLLRDQDPGTARGWYRRAAEAGDAVSQDQLSEMLLLLDPAEARHWAEQAAQQGVVAACARLGMLHHEAQGGPRDPAQAARCWRLAAEGGDGDSAAMLGAALLMGQGVTADPVEAMAWLIVGAARHSARVRGFFGRAEAALTPEQLAAARRRAATLRSTSPAPA